MKNMLISSTPLIFKRNIFPLRTSVWYSNVHCSRTSLVMCDLQMKRREGVFNAHNSHVWVTDNPLARRVHVYQRFSENVWADTVNYFLIGLYLLQTRLNNESFLISLKQVLLKLLQDVSIAIRKRICFQHDGAPPHFTADVRTYQNATFGARWIERGGPVLWPPRSPYL